MLDPAQLPDVPTSEGASDRAATDANEEARNLNVSHININIAIGYDMMAIWRIIR